MLRNEIWNQLLDTERLVRYYANKAQYYHKICLIVRGVLLLLYLVGISAYLEFMPLSLTILFGVVLATLTVISSIMSFDEKSAILRAIHSRCSRLCNQSRDLWLETALVHETRAGVLAFCVCSLGFLG